jgi:uncharacterized protein
VAIKKIYSDLKYGYEKISTGDFSSVFNESSINQSLLTLFSTRLGERFFNPSYGTTLYKYLYEPFDSSTANDIVDMIKRSVQFWEGRRIDITSIDIDMNHDSLVYNIVLTYSIKSTPLTGSLKLNLQKL